MKQKVTQSTKLKLVLIGFLCSFLFSAYGFKPSRSCEQSANSCAVQVQVTEATNTIHLSYQLPQLRIEQNYEKLYNSEPTSQLWFDGCITLRSEGEPVFPYIPAQVILPPNQTIDEVIFEGGSLQEISGRYTVEYGEAFHPISMPELARAPRINESVYSSSNTFPAKNAELVTIQHVRGVTIAYINICPIIFNPSQRSLSYYNQLSVRITTKPDISQGTGVRVRLDGIIDPGFRTENPEMLNRYVEGSIRGTFEQGLCRSEEKYSLVIITNKDIIDNTKSPSLEEFVQQKKSQSWTVKVSDIAAVYSSYSGSSNSEKLRKFIKSAYNNWKTEAVFLIGDVNVIPLRTVFDQAQASYKDSLPTDIPYQCIDADEWKDDYKAEVIIGRASAENAAEAGNILRKIIAYEKENTSEKYLKGFIHVGEDLGAQFNPRYAKQVLLQLVNGAPGAGTKGFNEYKDFTIGSLNDTSGYVWDAKVALEAINSNKYALMHHYGHCQYNYLMKMTHVEDPHASSKLKLDPKKDITNTKYGFLYSYGCIPGAYDKKCMAEAMTTTGPNGLWGVVLNSRYGWGGSMEAPSHQYGRKFWDAMCGKKMYMVGKMNQYAHEENIAKIKTACMRWCLLESNTLTDPTVKIRGVDGTTAISQMNEKGTITNNNTLRVAPNPMPLSYGHGITFSFPKVGKEGATLHIYNALGTEVSTSFINSGASSVTITFQNTVTRGSYVAVLKTQEYGVTKQTKAMIGITE